MLSLLGNKHCFPQCLKVLAKYATNKGLKRAQLIQIENKDSLIFYQVMTLSRKLCLMTEVPEFGISIVVMRKKENRRRQHRGLAQGREWDSSALFLPPKTGSGL